MSGLEAYCLFDYKVKQKIMLFITMLPCLSYETNQMATMSNQTRHTVVHNSQAFCKGLGKKPKNKRGLSLDVSVVDPDLSR